MRPVRRIYVACPIIHQAAALKFAAALEAECRVAIASTWIYNFDMLEDTSEDDAALDDIAARNQRDMDSADACVALVMPPIRGGMFVEMGYMAGQRKPVIAVGKRRDASAMCRIHGVAWVVSQAVALTAVRDLVALTP